MPSPYSPTAGADDGYWSSSLSSGAIDLRIYGYKTFIRQQLDIPQGVTVIGSSLTCVAAYAALSSANPGSAAFQAADTTAAPTSAASANEAFSTLATVVERPLGEWVQGEAYTTTGLEVSLQDVVSRVGWASGNYATLFLYGANPDHRAAAYDHTTYDPPLLTVTYTEGGGTTVPVWLLRHRSNLDLGGF